jgi:hypothetical protein
MMVNSNKHITRLIENSLRDAINEVKKDLVSSNQGDNIHFKRIVFNREHNLIVVEIRREQRFGLPESFFADNATRQVLFACSNCFRVDIMDLGESTFIYYWTTSNEQGEKTGALSLAYAILY